MASMNKHTDEIFRLLIEDGRCDVNQQTCYHLVTPLQAACRATDGEVGLRRVDLLKAGANPLLVDREGKTPFDYIVGVKGKAEMGELLKVCTGYVYIYICVCVCR